MLQGRRNYQEDRIFCDLNIRIPFFGKNGVKEVCVGMAAVFDGHRGAEAIDESMHLGILKEALVRTIRDIDITFTKEVSKNGIVSGCTAAIVIVADNQILVANVGDSKVVLCSQKFHSREDIRGTCSEYRRRRRNNANLSLKDHKNIGLSNISGLKLLSGKELTRDHHPDQEDERRRIEGAGGSVVSGTTGVPRVNGQLAVSRSIGDLYYKNFCVIAVPEVIDWQPLTRNDSYLVISSDGIFKKLNAQHVCQLLPDPLLPTTEEGIRLFDSCQSPLPECILRTAYEEGSMDSLSVIVVPLRVAGLIS
ncbi:hypothetical protein CRYUN_Cryun01aG0071200 [Craigia yunnanensis]